MVLEEAIDWSAAERKAIELIEAVGISVRTVALEESGHVDYFIGPQPHLALQLIGGAGRPRFDRLHQALEHTGQTVQQIQIGAATPASPSTTPAAAAANDAAIRRGVRISRVAT